MQSMSVNVWSMLLGGEVEDSRWKPELKRGDLDLELHSTFPAGYQGDFGNGELKIAPIVVRSPGGRCALKTPASVLIVTGQASRSRGSPPARLALRERGHVSRMPLRSPQMRWTLRTRQVKWHVGRTTYAPSSHSKKGGVRCQWAAILRRVNSAADGRPLCARLSGKWRGRL
ncbi:hypothetical protein BD626DRAFT_484020 [Schizophyllum amplum]|uniref:Uncharacterized protein n=1 Tax=Schizophyllum amplum TaxID=97359 RepID=A0A550CQ00_9AGAR|nr:hypothetical protein BD626DRAFT_484020 [Auriculariopsis ampla]